MPEHWLMWDVHITAQFEVAGKLKRLRFELRRRSRAAGEDAFNDQLCDEV
jgi:hypothetical protein